MKVIAILSVDEDVLNEVKEGEETTIDKVVSEFAWLHDSGIILDECHDLENSDIDNVTDEYQLLIWNKEKEEYSPVGQCQKTLEQWAAVADTVIGGRILPKPKSICFTIIHNKKQANYSIINIYGK